MGGFGSLVCRDIFRTMFGSFDEKEYPGKHLFFSLSHVLLWGLVFAFFTLHPALEFPVFQPPVVTVRVVENAGKYMGGYVVM